MKRLADRQESRTDSFIPKQMAVNSSSQVDVAIQVCFLDLNDTDPCNQEHKAARGFSTADTSSHYASENSPRWTDLFPS